MSIFSAAPFLGPTIGPIVGGFLAQTEGWRWVEGLMAIFTGALWLIGALLIPETYSPVILRRRAAKLSKMTGKVYKSRMEVEQGQKTLGAELKTAISRPWILLLKEPIVLLLSIYMAIIYGTLYLMFAAFPIVYQVNRGWSEGIGGLAFIGVAVGMMFAVAYSIFDNRRYNRVASENNGKAPPEARLPPSMLGSIFLPLGLFWFAWTNYPSIHWSASIIGTAPFGFGMVLVFLSIMNYLIDAYTIYAASVLAANSVLRSLFGAIFPLFTSCKSNTFPQAFFECVTHSFFKDMYQNLGIHWASSIPAFLALMCVPFPFLFYKYGRAIRLRCKFAAEAARQLEENEKREKESDEAGEAENSGNPGSADNAGSTENGEKREESGRKDEESQ
jgi:MFS family permease